MRIALLSVAFVVLSAAPATSGLHAADLDLGDGVRLKLASIPAGKFMMGSPKGSVGAAFDESDRHRKDNVFQHEVTFTRSFLIGVTEVTQEQYIRVTGRNPGVFQGANLPVDNVSWNDAVKFCELLSVKTGKVVRLPTEAEWEYACRAGTTTRYYFGDDLDHARLAEHAWFETNSDRRTHPVGKKEPNSWGLHDMGGNVWEWCADRYKGPYEDKTVSDPRGAASGEMRVLRGGCWESGPLSARGTNRGGIVPTRATSRFGFRVVVETS